MAKAKAKASSSAAWNKTETFLSPKGWLISTTYDHQAGASTIEKSTDITKLSDLPTEVQEALQNGELTIVTV